MPRVQKYVHDENIRRFKEKLSATTDSDEIRQLEAMIQQEEELYEAALSLEDKSGSRRQGGQHRS